MANRVVRPRCLTPRAIPCFKLGKGNCRKFRSYGEKYATQILQFETGNSPEPVKDEPDTLLLTWRAEDRNLAENPISLEWSEAGREWSAIGDPKLPNTGKFIWKVPAKIPDKVHFKLTVRDVAGNVAVAQTHRPVLIDFRVPEVGSVVLED